jgi:hypothetical protein
LRYAVNLLKALLLFLMSLLLCALSLDAPLVVVGLELRRSSFG